MTPPRSSASSDVFHSSVRYFALVSVNMLVERNPGEFLYVLRRNAPACGQWWLPGGRVLNSETIEAATMSVLKAETGITGNLVAISPKYLEEIWPTDGFTDEDWRNYDRASKTIHYLSTIAYVKMRPDDEIRLDDQSEEWKWSTNILDDHPFMLKYFTSIEEMGYDLKRQRIMR